MKLIAFFALIALALVVSLKVGRSELRKGRDPLQTALKGVLINFIILGLGTIWWFLTEQDGISQAVGGLIYLVSTLLISMLNIIVLYFFGKKDSEPFRG